MMVIKAKVVGTALVYVWALDPGGGWDENSAQNVLYILLPCLRKKSEGTYVS